MRSGGAKVLDFPLNFSLSVLPQLPNAFLEIAIVSMAVTPRKTKNTVSIGAVYTAPAHRKNSYASGLVATLSQKMLDTGFQKCVLVTDLANATCHIQQNLPKYWIQSLL
jgi:hypothetical protein